MGGSAARLALLGAVCLGAIGCLHRVRATVPRVPNAPMEMLPLPALERVEAAEIAKVPPPSQESVPSAAAVQRELRRLRRRPAVRAAAPPVQVATATAAPDAEVMPDAVVIGELTTGGDSTERRQAAVGLIADNDRRLARIAAGLARDRRAQIAQVKDFQKKARAALDSGDADGAVTLATKARLLLDDLLKS